MNATNTSTVAAKPRGSGSLSLIASPWHTAIVLAIVGLNAYWALTRAAEARGGMGPGRPAIYLRTIATEWVVLAAVVIGVKLRGVSLEAVFGEKWRSVGAVLRDAALGTAAMVMALVLVTIIGALFGEGSADGTVRFLLPQSAQEKALWILVSMSAGICEEAVYRGYLQRQFAAMTGRVPAGIIMSGLAFGAVHLYQGLSRAASIAMLGMFFGLVAQWRKSVRPVMVAHALQDGIAPVLLRLARHAQ